jgi:hypothetical protein
MEKNIIVLFLILNFLPLTAKNNLTEAEEVSLTFNEMSHYIDATVQFYTALHAYKQKNHDQIPKITCKFCPQRALPCDELLVKIQARAIDKAIAQASIADKIRRKMLTIYHEVTQLINTSPENNIRKFMAKIARKEKIPCEACQKTDWIAKGIGT